MLNPKKKTAVSLLSAALVLSPLVAVSPISVFAETTQGAVDTASQQVNFPDANLEKAIRAALNKPTDPITQDDMKNLSQLYNISTDERSAIQDLTGLEYAVNLGSLTLSQRDKTAVGIKDLSPIRNLSRLKYLALSNQSISDISPLSQLTMLEEVYLASCNISDISALSNLPYMHLISLNNNQVQDISPLGNMRWGNSEIYLSNNKIKDFTPITNLVKNKNWSMGIINLSLNEINVMTENNINQINEIRQHGVQLSVNPQRGSLAGIVLDEEGRPAPNVKISIAGSVPYDGPTPTVEEVTGSAVTDQYGEYDINTSIAKGESVPKPYVPSGPYSVTVGDASSPQFTGGSITGGITRLDLTRSADGSWDITPPTVRPAYLTKYQPTDTQGHWARETLENAIHADIVNGYTEDDGSTTIRPDKQITRAEFVTLLVRALNLQSTQPGKDFADVPKSQWYSDYIRIASSLGIVNGVADREFAPYRPIQRDEIVALLVRAFSSSIRFDGANKQFVDVPDYWAQSYIGQAAGVGLVNGYPGGEFRPRLTATRAEAILMIMRALDREQSHLPDDKLLTDIVLKNETEAVAAYNVQDYDALLAVNDRYSTGYYKAQFDWSTELTQKKALRGYTLHQTLTGTLAARVISKNDRLANVEMTGAIYEVTSTRGDEVNSKTEDTSGILQMKKTADGTWKIYNIIQK